MDSRLQRKPQTEEQLVEVEADLELFRSKDVPALLTEYADIKEWREVAWELDCQQHESDYKVLHHAAHWLGYEKSLEAREKSLEEERNDIEDAFLSERTKFVEYAGTVDRKVEKFREYGTLKHVDEYLDKIVAVKDLFSQVDERMEEITHKEKLLGNLSLFLNPNRSLL